MTRIAIYGAGAIGGYLGALLADTDAELTLIARGPHLAAIKKNGLSLEMAGERTTRQIAATDDPAEAGEQDFVIVALKAHSVPGVVGAMQPLLGADTAVVTAVNGGPWWYFHDLEGPDASGTALGPNAPSAVLSIRPATFASPAWSSTSKATASSWANPVARRPGASSFWAD